MMNGKITRTAIYACIFIEGWLFCSCSKPEEKTPPLLFEGKTKDLVTYSGYNRVQVKFSVDTPDFGFCRIYWFPDNRKDSITLSKEKSVDNFYSVIIDNLPEKRLQFTLTVFDESGRASVNSSYSECEVYGEKYINSLKNRDIKNKMFITGDTPWVEWTRPQAKETELVVTYTNLQGEESKKKITNKEFIAELPSYKKDTPIYYHSRYLPEENCLDTFNSKQETIPAPVFYASKPVKYIVEKSSLVENLISESSRDIHSDVKYANVQFTDKQGKPVSVFVLEVDLSKKNVTMGVLMPDNQTTFGLQTVKEMAQYRENSGEKVIAAVNGDFFEWTGIPWGPVVVKGEIVKDYKSASGTYFGITKDGKPAIGIFTSGTNLSTFGEMLGGGHWLVENGMAGNWESNREPRTSVGYIAGKSAYLVVIDGRQSGYSAGVTLIDLALIMQSLGVDQAINLDGGGSSLMCVKDDGNFQIVNRYSDANPRRVANALSIIEK